MPIPSRPKPAALPVQNQPTGSPIKLPLTGPAQADPNQAAGDALTASYQKAYDDDQAQKNKQTDISKAAVAAQAAADAKPPPDVGGPTTGPVGPTGRPVSGFKPSADSLNLGNTLQNASDQFEKNKGGLIAGQVAGAQDSARLSLASDIQKAKADANARGMLYSGQEAGAEADSRAQEGSKLASNIQGINASVQATSDYKKNMAVAEATQKDQHDVGMASLQASASQTAYEQALQEQQNMNEYYSGIAQGVGSLIGKAGALIAGA